MDSRKNSVWEDEREIRIKVSPKRILKIVSFFVLLLFMFYMGRWTAPSTISTETTVVEAPEEIPKNTFSISGWVTGLFASDEEPNTTQPAATTVPETPQATPEAPAAAPAPAAENTTPTAPTGAATAQDEDVITTYDNKVALALNGVKKDWKETWGKITSFDLTIKNSETGAVKTAYIIMAVEGYDDGDKKIIFGQTIKAGKTLQYTIPVPHGFAYNAVTAGDLTSVDITIQLFDSSDKLISTTKNSMNLQG